jgi:hypothetical protein
MSGLAPPPLTLSLSFSLSLSGTCAGSGRARTPAARWACLLWCRPSLFRSACPSVCVCACACVCVCLSVSVCVCLCLCVSDYLWRRLYVVPSVSLSRAEVRLSLRRSADSPSLCPSGRPTEKQCVRACVRAQVSLSVGLPHTQCARVCCLQVPGRPGPARLSPAGPVGASGPGQPGPSAACRGRLDRPPVSAAGGRPAGVMRESG